MESNNIKEYDTFKNLWRNKNNKNKEDNIYDLIKNNDERAIQLLNSIWIVFHYNNIKNTIKKLKETSYRDYRERKDYSKYMYTLEINIEQALEYFNNVLKNIKEIYEEKRDEYVLYVSHQKRKEVENMFDGFSQGLIKKPKFLLEEEEYEFDGITNDIIDNDYLKQMEKENMDSTQEELFRNLDIVRICICNTLKILGDLYRYRCSVEGTRKKMDELKSCTFYFKALYYVKRQGHTYNQCSLLYVNGDPIRCLYFYFLSLVSMKPVENREAVVLFIERILTEGRKLNDKTNSRDIVKRNKMKRRKAVEQISRTVHVICKKKGKDSDEETVSKSTKMEHEDKREGRKYEEEEQEQESNEELQYRRELCDALLNFYISYFKIVKMLFCKIDMNKFEKKKNKFIYYINKYIKIQYHNQKEDQVMLRNLIIIVFTLISIILHLVIQEEYEMRTRGFFFYGNIQIRPYVYKNEQIFFTLLLLYDILVSCKMFCEHFYPHYLTIFVFLMYWIKYEANMHSVDFTQEIDSREHEERIAFIRQYHADYKNSSTYVLSKKKGSSRNRRKTSLTSETLHENTNLYYYDILKSIIGMIRSVHFEEEKEEYEDEDIKLSDNDLLKYKLPEDYYVFPFLGIMKFEKIESENKKTERKERVNNLPVVSNDSVYSLDERSSIEYDVFQEESMDSQDSNEDDVVLVKRPLFSKSEDILNNMNPSEKKKTRTEDKYLREKDWNDRSKHRNDKYDGILEKNVLVESNDIEDSRITWEKQNEEDPVKNDDKDLLNPSFFTSNYIYPSLFIYNNPKLEERVRKARYISLRIDKKSDCKELTVLMNALYIEDKESKNSKHQDIEESSKPSVSTHSNCEMVKDEKDDEKEVERKSHSFVRTGSVEVCKEELSKKKKKESENDSEESRYVDIGSMEDLFLDNGNHQKLKEHEDLCQMPDLYETKQMNYNMKEDPIMYQTTGAVDCGSAYPNENKKNMGSEKRENDNDVDSNVVYNFKGDNSRKNKNYFETFMLNHQNTNGTRVVKKENLSMNYKRNYSGNISLDNDNMNHMNKENNGNNTVTRYPEVITQGKNMHDKRVFRVSSESNGICNNNHHNNIISSNNNIEGGVHPVGNHYPEYTPPMNNESVYGYDENNISYPNKNEEGTEMNVSWGPSAISQNKDWNQKKELESNCSSAVHNNRRIEYNTVNPPNDVSSINDSVVPKRNMIPVDIIMNNSVEENVMHHANYPIPQFVRMPNNETQEKGMIDSYNRNLSNNRIVLIDGIELGMCFLDNGIRKFSIQRIDAALSYFKCIGYETHVLMPREYFKNSTTCHNIDYTMRMMPNNNEPIQCTTIAMNPYNEESILSQSDILFFEHLFSLNFLIIQPLSVYYQYCVECIEKYNACIVMNFPFYEKNEYKMDVIWHELVEKYNIPEHFITYEFKNNVFIPNMNFRWPKKTWK